MDKIIITGLLVIAGVITAVILFGTLRTSVEDAAETTKTAGARADAQTRSGVTVIRVIAGPNGTRLDIWAKNTGSIPINQLEKIDIFLADIEGNWGDYILYMEAGPAADRNTWRVVSPADLTWRPGETFQLRASLPVNPVSNTGYNLTITTPDLYTEKYRFDVGP